LDSPQHKLPYSIECVRQLGTVRTDANGNAGRTVDFPKSRREDVYAFEISPEGDQPGQSCRVCLLKNSRFDMARDATEPSKLIPKLFSTIDWRLEPVVAKHFSAFWIKTCSKFLSLGPLRAAS